MNYIGWLGAVSFIIAYLLLSLQYISATRPLYHILNILGALFLGINACFIDDYPNIAVNAIWGFIAAFAIYRLNQPERAEKE